MTQTSIEDRAAIEQLASELRALGGQVTPPEPSTQTLFAIEQRSQRVTLNRRWGVACAVVAALGLLTGVFWQRLGETVPPVVAVAPSPSPTAHGVLAQNTSGQASGLDLGIGVGRALLRSGAMLTYDPEARRIDLRRGTVAVHVFAGELSVQTPTTLVEVTGTVFEVSAASDEVRVWEGSVSVNGRTVTGDGVLTGLSDDDMLLLAVEPPRTARSKPRKRRVTSPSHDSDDRLLVLRAHEALATSEPTRARVLLREHRRRFPDSALAEEADLLTLQALVAEGDTMRVHEEAARFLERYPMSSQVEQVRELLQ